MLSGKKFDEFLAILAVFVLIWPIIELNLRLRLRLIRYFNQSNASKILRKKNKI